MRDLRRILTGRPVEVRFVPSPRAYRGRLHTQGARGAEIHGASLVRRRMIVLDEQLLSDPPELGRILVHELFHFVWARLGNAKRRDYERLLRLEWRRRAKGELGWSSELVKRRLRSADLARRSRRWREYVCESFCDSAAWRLGDLSRHDEFTLGAKFRAGRRLWLDGLLAERPLRV
ncbi:MAG: hypothetical protein ACRD44_07420 [Bryobacteraceae bacterium]